MINLQKELVRVMEAFTDGLYTDLQELRNRVVDHAQETEAYFKESMHHAEKWRTKVSEAFVVTTDKIKVALI